MISCNVCKREFPDTKKVLYGWCKQCSLLKFGLAMFDIVYETEEELINKHDEIPDLTVKGENLAWTHTDKMIKRVTYEVFKKKIKDGIKHCCICGDEDKLIKYATNMDERTNYLCKDCYFIQRLKYTSYYPCKKCDTNGSIYCGNCCQRYFFDNPINYDDQEFRNKCSQLRSKANNILALIKKGIFNTSDFWKFARFNLL